MKIFLILALLLLTVELKKQTYKGNNKKSNYDSSKRKANKDTTKTTRKNNDNDVNTISNKRKRG